MRAPISIWILRLIFVLFLWFEAWLHQKRSRLDSDVTPLEVLIWVAALAAIGGSFIRRISALYFSVVVFILQLLWWTVSWNMCFKMDWVEWCCFLILEMALPVWLAWHLLSSPKVKAYFASSVQPGSQEHSPQ